MATKVKSNVVCRQVQFPSYAACPLCRRAHRHGLFDHQPDWDEAKVLQYLMLFYAKENVKDDVVKSKGTSIAHGVLVCIADVVPERRGGGGGGAGRGGVRNGERQTDRYS